MKSDSFISNDFSFVTREFSDKHMAPKPIEELDDFIIMQINDAMLNIIAGERRNLQSGVASPRVVSETGRLET